MTVEQRIFISYSRQQLYFAEALSKQLQKTGIDVWMDLQQLEPGSDWRAQIQNALDSCTALVLVASEQALASPYVQEEWLAAIAADKPVAIALYQAVHLPEALQNTSLIDFRGRFKPAVKTLAACLLHRRRVRQPTPLPNRLNLPTKLPPGIRIVTLGLLLAALLTPPFLLDSFPPLIPPFLILINGLYTSAILLRLTWSFLHHRFSPQLAIVPFFLPIIIYGFYQMSEFIQGNFNEALEIKWMVMIGVSYLLLGTLSLVLGPELLRWSAPGETEIQRFRRWVNRPARRKNRAATNTMLNTMLAVRAGQPFIASAESASQDSLQVTPRSELSSPETYTLHYARNDRPVAASMRWALRRQRLREEKLGGDVHILILSQYLPSIQLQELMQTSVQKVILLVGNVSLQGSALMEQVTRLQIIDFRQRSRKTLIALARTLKNPIASNLPVALETTPKSFRETVLPLGTRQIGFGVISIGVYLLLSGLAALILGLMDMLPLEPLDLPGLLLGPLLIRQGRKFWGRRTTRWVFAPAFAFSVWLGISIFFLAFYLYSFELPSNPLYLILTPSRFLTLNEEFPIILFLPFTFFLVPFMLLDHIIRFWNWLPASPSRPNRQACLKSLPDRRANHWVFRGWLVGIFLAFGLPLAFFLFYYFLFQVFRFPY